MAWLVAAIIARRPDTDTVTPLAWLAWPKHTIGCFGHIDQVCMSRTVTHPTQIGETWKREWETHGGHAPERGEAAARPARLAVRQQHVVMEPVHPNLPTGDENQHNQHNQCGVCQR